jgi:3-dehydroquinate synthase
MRGLPVIHVPTTLLAMVDSSIGGKVAVNIDAGKNIVGAFHQPETVISDIHFLKTLPDNEIKNGLTEALKHAFLGESRLLHLFQNNDAVSIRSPENLEKIVYLSAIFKAAIVAKDEKEGGLRAVLNLGHTVGHAIESLLEFRGISHGEAVALGLKAVVEISRRLGWLSADEYTGAKGLLDRYGLVGNRLSLDAGGIVDHMKYDKKNIGGEIRMVLLRRIGEPVYDQKLEEPLIREALVAALA